MIPPAVLVSPSSILDGVWCMAEDRFAATLTIIWQDEYFRLPPLWIVARATALLTDRNGGR